MDLENKYVAQELAIIRFVSLNFLGMPKVYDVQV